MIACVLQVYIELTLNQIIRSGIPVFTAALGVVVEKKMPTRVEMVGILVLTAGVVTCLYEGSSVDGSLKGILLCLASTLCGAAMLSFSGAVLDQTEKMDPVRLNFYSAPVAIAVSKLPSHLQNCLIFTRVRSCTDNLEVSAQRLSRQLLLSLPQPMETGKLQTSPASLKPIVLKVALMVLRNT